MIKRIPQENKSSGLVKSLISSAVSGIVLGGLFLGVDYWNTFSKRNYITDNCTQNTTIATSFDARDGYTGVARRIMQYSDCDLNDEVGMNFLKDELKRINNEKDLVKGQPYETYNCDCETK